MCDACCTALLNLCWNCCFPPLPCSLIGRSDFRAEGRRIKPLSTSSPGSQFRFDSAPWTCCCYSSSVCSRALKEIHRVRHPRVEKSCCIQLRKRAQISSHSPSWASTDLPSTFIYSHHHDDLLDTLLQLNKVYKFVLYSRYYSGFFLKDMRS